jgi:hypothetical protein
MGFFSSMGTAGSIATGGALSALPTAPGKLNNMPQLGRKMMRQQPQYNNLRPLPGQQGQSAKPRGGSPFVSQAIANAQSTTPFLPTPLPTPLMSHDLPGAGSIPMVAQIGQLASPATDSSIGGWAEKALGGGSRHISSVPEYTERGDPGMLSGVMQAESRLLSGMRSSIRY